MKETKEDLLYLAKLAEQAERYDGKPNILATALILLVHASA